MALLIIPTIIAVACLVYVLVRHREKIPFSSWLMLLPHVVVGAYIVYARLIAPPGTCGSQDPGSCFGWGIIVGVVFMPLALILTPFVILRIWRAVKSGKKPH